MAKIPFDDVVPPSKRSIRNIPIPNGGKRKTQEIKTSQGFTINKINTPPSKDNLEENHVTEGLINRIPNKTDYTKPQSSTGPYEYYYPKNDPGKSVENKSVFGEKYERRSGKKYVYSGIAGLVIILFIIIMMTVFSSATVNIVPRTQYLSVSMDVDAVNDPVSEGVRFEIIKISKSKTVPVRATGEEDAEIKASGRIMIFNNFSSEPQRLINRTRFESPNGLIYRIPESVVVPGKRVENGTEVPGSIEVEIFADEPGERYNIDKVDFTIPGFKDDAPRYAGFYARSVTPMTGGFVGVRKTVLESEKQNALTQIEIDLKDDLLKDVTAKTPDNLVHLDGLVTFESYELPQQSGDSESVSVGKEVVANVVVLNKEDLSKIIILNYMDNYPLWNNIPAKIDDFSGIKGVFKEAGNLESPSNLDINITGNATVVANINDVLIKERILGVERKRADFVMDEFPGISSMTASLRPVWKKSFPDNPDKIRVIQTLP